MNCIHDLMLTALPMVIVKDLNMNLRIKVILSVLMGMSILCVLESLVLQKPSNHFFIVHLQLPLSKQLLLEILGSVRISRV